MIHATSLVLAEYRRKWPDPLILHFVHPDPMDDSGVGPVAFSRHHRRGSGVADCGVHGKAPRWAASFS